MEWPVNIRTFLATVGVLALPTAALAQPIDGLYLGLGAGYNSLARQSFTGSQVGPYTFPGQPVNANLQSNGGWVVPASVGYGFGNGFRIELEGGYRHTEQHLGGTATIGSGTNQTIDVMVNAFYDIDVGLPWMYPYVGAGAGYTWTSLTSFSGTFDSGRVPFNVSNHTENSGAAQGILGLSFPISGVPGLSATAEFRYMATFGNETFNAQSRTGISATVQYQANFSGLLGLRYALYTPPPPPPPAPAPVAAPAPAPARTYLVFFDWDKADLTERARQIIAEAAQNASRVQLTRIEVNGYTDTSGTAKYNMGLSIRRAKAVAAELVKDGVPANEIVTQGFGDTHLLVPTGPGVREPQNRRVEIILK